MQLLLPRLESEFDGRLSTVSWVAVRLSVSTYHIGAALGERLGNMQSPSRPSSNVCEAQRKAVVDPPP
jgi:hypothetical protein